MWISPRWCGAAGRRPSPTSLTREPQLVVSESLLERKTAGRRWWKYQSSTAASQPGMSWKQWTREGRKETREREERRKKEETEGEKCEKNNNRLCEQVGSHEETDENSAWEMLHSKVTAQTINYISICLTHWNLSNQKPFIKHKTSKRPQFSCSRSIKKHIARWIGINW